MWTKKEVTPEQARIERERRVMASANRCSARTGTKKLKPAPVMIVVTPGYSKEEAELGNQCGEV
jgi:hypothetical protein